MTTAAEAEVVHEGEIVADEEKPVNGKPKKKSQVIARRDAKRELAEVGAEAPRASIEQMIMKAMEMDKPELIDKFVEIYEKQEAERKKAAYTTAMARAQTKMTPVANNAINAHTHSRYAKLAAINRMAVPIYGAEGLAVSFKTGVAEQPDERRTIAVVSHEAGHVDDSFFVDLPLDDKGSAGTTNKTRLHATKSTSTYAKNMLICMIFNISTEDEDDDGNAGAGISPADARKARTVKQPKERPGTGQQEVPYADRPQIEPVEDEKDAIDKATAKGFAKAIQHAFAGYGEQALQVGLDEFKRRFPKIDRMGQIPNTPDAQKIVLGWISNPQKN